MTILVIFCRGPFHKNHQNVQILMHIDKKRIKSLQIIIINLWKCVSKFYKNKLTRNGELPYVIELVVQLNVEAELVHYYPLLPIDIVLV